MGSALARQGLVRPRRGRWIAGVCAGLGQRFSLPRLAVRLLFVASVILPGPQFLAYLVLWLLMPNEDGSARTAP